VNSIRLIRMSFKPASRLFLAAALASVIGAGEAPAQATTQPGPVAVYRFQQNGKAKDYVLSETEVVEVDATGTHALREVGAGALDVLSRSRQPAKGAKASHLVLYPLGKQPTEGNRRILRDRLLVQFEQGTTGAAVAAQLEALSSEAVPGMPDRVVLTFENAAETVGKVGAAIGTPGVISAEPLLARTVNKRLTPDDFLYPEQWHLNNTGVGGTQAGTDVNAEPAWDAAPNQGAGVSIAIVDDGVEDDHPDLPAGILGFNWNGGNAPDSPRPFFDFDDHGTAVAGLAAAVGNNLEGVAGVAFQANIIGLRLIAGPFDDLDESQALAWPTDISNNSWGTDDLTTELEGPGPLALAAIQDGVATGRGNLGIIYTWAAGNGAETNDNSNYDGYAALPETIAVGAVTDEGEQAIYSEPGANLVVSAPSDGGVFEMTTTNYRGMPIDPNANPVVYPFADYRNDFGGTSAATPLVSGVVALMLEANPGLGWRDVQEILMKTAHRVQVDSTITGTGPGNSLVDAATDFDVALGNSGIYYLVPDDGANAGIPSLVTGWTGTTITISDDYGSDLTWGGDYQVISLVAPSSADWVFNAAGFHFNHDFGAGLVNAEAAVQEAAGWTNLGMRETYEIDQIPVVAIPDGDGNSIVLEFDASNVGTFPRLRVEHVEVLTTAIHTRRADLDIILVSPNGTQSILAQTHTNSIEQSISNWPFMSVRNWGEGSEGVWVLKITDKRVGESGFLNNVRLRIHGVVDPNAPVSQAPVLISNRVVFGVEATPLTYSLESLGADSVTINGALPAGLTFTPGPNGTGTISGTPTAPGLSATAITLVGPNPGPDDDANLNLSFIIEPITSSLGDAALHELEPDRPSISAGDQPWIFEFVDTNGDSDSVGSPLELGPEEWSQFGFIINSPGVVTYDWRVSSEAGADRLWFLIGGGGPPTGAASAPPPGWEAFIDGETPWRSVAAIMPSSTSNPVQWRYTKNGLGDAGDDRAFVNDVRFLPMQQYLDDIAGNVEANFPLTHTSRTLWMPVDDPAATNGDAIVTSGIGNGQSVSFESTFFGPGVLTFDWRVSSESDTSGMGLTGDVLKVKLNGLVVDYISGSEPNYLQVSIPIPELPGGVANIVEWEYLKDFSGFGGDDRAHLDNFNFVQFFTYSSWQAMNFTPAQILAGDADPDANADGDQFTNFEEYVFMGDPNVVDRPKNLPTIGPGPAPPLLQVSFTIDPALTDVEWKLFESPDLTPGSWTDVTGFAAELPPGSGDWVFVTAPIPGADRYYQVVATQAP
jgi:subtilisin family serine protease/subtilisin-like proprotein convertase family protein/signal peptidase I